LACLRGALTGAGVEQVGNPEFAIIDEAFPYLSKRLLTDDAPRLRAALRYMVYGKGNTFDVDRLIELLQVLVCASPRLHHGLLTLCPAP